MLLRDPRGLGLENFKEMEDSLYVQVEDEIFGEDWLDSYATTIFDAKCEKADILEVVNNQKQLNTAQRNDLLRILKNMSLYSTVHLACVRINNFILN